MAPEVELKLLADSRRPLEALERVERLGAAELGPPSTFDEVDRYLDTPDARLAQHGWACRLRGRAGTVIVSLKGPPEASAVEWLHRRPEVEGPATGDLVPARWPPSPARDLLESLAGEAAVVEQLRLRQQRTERTVSVSGKTIGTLSLDDVRVETREHSAGRFFVVELELHAGEEPASASVSSVAEALLAVPGLAPDRQTKLERALAAIG